MILFDRGVRLDLYTDTKKLSISDLHIDFDVDAHRRRAPNHCEVQIYNLGRSLRDVVQGEATYLELCAGYKTKELGRIFKGYINTGSSLRSGVDWVTGIKAADTGKNKVYTHSTISKTFSKGTPVSMVLSSIAGILNMPMISDYKKGDVLLSSETYVGSVKDALDDVCGDRALGWSIQHGVLEIIDKGGSPIRDSKAFVITGSNIIGAPEKTRGGVKVKTLIIPQLIPSRLMSLDVEGFEGVYVIDSVHYIGSNYGSNYYAEVVAMEEP